VAATWFLTDESSRVGNKLLESYRKEQVDFHMPVLWSLEILNLLLAARKRKRLNETDLAFAIKLFNNIECTWHDQTDAHCRRRIFDFAQLHRLTIYDAAYLELADRLRVPLITFDKELLDAAAAEDMKVSLC